MRLTVKRGSAFSRHISHVIRLRADKQVAGINATRIVARMANDAASHFHAGYSRCDPVGLIPPPLPVKFTVTRDIFCGCPFVTKPSPLMLGEEPGFEGFCNFRHIQHAARYVTINLDPQGLIHAPS